MSAKESNTNSTARCSWRRYTGTLVGLVLIVASAVAVRVTWGPGGAAAQAPASRAEAANAQAKGEAKLPAPPSQFAAVVNGERISRQDLAKACVVRYGEEVLEALVNKRLIQHYCKRRNVTVTNQEIDAEIEKIAQRFRLNKQEYLSMLKRERNISPRQYAQDLLWPKLALEKLAHQQIVPTEDEIQRAYQTTYGPAVQTRIIVVNDQATAAQLREKLLAQPDEFARTAIQHSKDINSASNGGLIQPIRRHMGDPNLERAAFSLQPGEISNVIPVANQFVIVKCESHMPAREVSLDDARESLSQQVREQKLRKASETAFRQMQDDATVENIYNDPERRQSMPGVVALINDEPITMRELEDECLALHGEDVVEREIGAALLRQELRRRKMQVAQADVDAEMAHAAQLNGVVDAQGRPDLNKWMAMATTEQGISKEDYLRDSVWPSAALKKLTNGQVTVSKDDIRKGVEANYGQRVRCRAIMMSNQRRAQEVWDKARQNPTAEHFGKLAQEFSVEPGSKAHKGEIPPIQRHGGQPVLEEEAFKLKPGQLSGVIQFGPNYVILFCEGYTEPVNVDLAEVEPLIYRDLFEKKLRLAMRDEFLAIKERSQIDNYLAGTSQSPKKPSGDKSARAGRTGGIERASHSTRSTQPTRR